ncbi:hypothetical protein SPHV1_2280003 [Novosphingobium sp. KN65.2]|nr:hypothetical protein SPHV1_2280003 [Novosphingobium sp. KN65.2]
MARWSVSGSGKTRSSAISSSARWKRTGRFSICPACSDSRTLSKQMESFADSENAPKQGARATVPMESDWDLLQT